MNRKLTHIEKMEVRREAELAAESHIVCDDESPLSNEDYESLPALDPLDDKDLLSPGLIKAICNKMLESSVALETAAQCSGLPPDLARDYADRGCEDMRRGRWSRMAFFAVFVNRVEGKVKCSLCTMVRQTPMAWMGPAWLLERQWPASFTANQKDFKAAKTASVGEAVFKQLEQARLTSSTPLPLYVENVSKD